MSDKKKKRKLVLGKVIDEIRKSVRNGLREKVTIIKRNDKDGGEYRQYKPLSNSNWDHPSKNKTELGESKPRDYKAEYKKYGSSTKAKKYRAELNKYNRQKGTYGNGDKKDASHKGGKIVGFEAESKNRGRAEKSRLKKEGKLTESQVAKTILQQLGGNKFIAMTGAKNLGASGKSLSMKIGRNSKSISHVVITLKSSDLYDMEFIRIRGTSRKVVKKVTGVYADMLGKMFKKYTGMNVRL